MAPKASSLKEKILILKFVSQECSRILKYNKVIRKIPRKSEKNINLSPIKSELL